MLSWRAVDIFSLLGHGIRFSVLTRLIEDHPTTMTIAEVATDLGIARSTARRHIYKLADAGLITGRRSGRALRFQAEATTILDFLHYLDTRLCPPGRRVKFDRQQAKLLSTKPYVSLRDRLNDIGSRAHEHELDAGAPYRPRQSISRREGSLLAALDRLTKQ